MPTCSGGTSLLLSSMSRWVDRRKGQVQAQTLALSLSHLVYLCLAHLLLIHWRGRKGIPAGPLQALAFHLPNFNTPCCFLACRNSVQAFIPEFFAYTILTSKWLQQDVCLLHVSTPMGQGEHHIQGLRVGATMTGLSSSGNA